MHLEFRRRLNLTGLIAGQQERDELDGEDIADDITQIQAVIEDDELRADVVQEALTGDEIRRTNEKIHQYILSDVLMQDLLHRSLKVRCVEILCRRNLQLLDLMEKMLHEDDLRIFPEDLFAQGHVLHSPEATLYSPKELMEMDWLDECVEGGLPHYDELDVKTHTLMSINGINTLKGFVK